MDRVDDWSQRRVTIGGRIASEAVFDDLRAAIESGELPVGARLPSENLLATRYGVSRTVIREALRSTATLGFTATRSGSGTFVVAHTAVQNPTYGAYSARDLLEARPAIEIPAAGYAATRCTAAQLDQLARLCDRMDTETGPAEWVVLDSEFHCEIAAASGNQVFARIVNEARDALAQQSRLIGALTSRRGRVAASNAEHRAIVDAIRAHDPQQARTAMRTHLDRVRDIMSTVMPSDSDADHQPGPQR